MIKNWELVNGKYKITYEDGEIQFIPKKIFENTYTYLGFELNKAVTELLKQLFKLIGIYRICKLFNLSIKEKWRL